jgi:CheY-like chemotaxis protein
MKIKCENCSTLLELRKEKLPDKQQVVARCPECREVLTFDSAELKSGTPETIITGKLQRKAGTVVEDNRYGYEEDTLEVFEENAQLALVMENDVQQVEMLRQAVEELGYTYVSAASTRDAIDKMRTQQMMERDAQQVEMLRRAVESLGYTYVTAENTREAIGKMRFHSFDLLILSDGFDDIELAESPVRHYLNHQPMSIRRHMFLVLLGDSFKTMDELTAFSLSADLVVNRKDLGKLTTILKQAVLNKQKFYKVFLDTLVEAGRS